MIWQKDLKHKASAMCIVANSTEVAPSVVGIYSKYTKASEMNRLKTEEWNNINKQGHLDKLSVEEIDFCQWMSINLICPLYLLSDNLNDNVADDAISL